MHMLYHTHLVPALVTGLRFRPNSLCSLLPLVHLLSSYMRGLCHCIFSLSPCLHYLSHITMDSPVPQRDNRDRFITTRDPADEVAATLDLMSLNPESASPGHTARLAAATGVPLNRRILAYHEPPPPASSQSPQPSSHAPVRTGGVRGRAAAAHPAQTGRITLVRWFQHRRTR